MRKDKDNDNVYFDNFEDFYVHFQEKEFCKDVIFDSLFEKIDNHNIIFGIKNVDLSRRFCFSEVTIDGEKYYNYKNYYISKEGKNNEKEIWLKYKYCRNQEKYITDMKIYYSKESVLEENNGDYIEIFVDPYDQVIEMILIDEILVQEYFEDMDEFLSSFDLSMYYGLTINSSAKHAVHKIDITDWDCSVEKDKIIYINNQKYICVDCGESVYVKYDNFSKWAWGIFCRRTDHFNDYKGNEVYATKKEAVQSLIDLHDEVEEPDYIVKDYK